MQGRYFEYLLTRFSEPNEVFGPIDLARLREGTVATVTTGMLPEAEFVFLDELFNANSAILNNLLTVLNERVYRRGAEVHRLPLLSLFSASNHLPEDEALGALFDRFLLRCHVDNLKREAMPRLLAAGWALERAPRASTSVSAADLRPLSRKVHDVEPDPGDRTLRRGRLQGPRPRRGAFGPPGGQGAQAAGGLGAAVRPGRRDPPTSGCSATSGTARSRSTRWPRWSTACSTAPRRARRPPSGRRPEAVDAEELARQLDSRKTS